MHLDNLAGSLLIIVLSFGQSMTLPGCSKPITMTTLTYHSNTRSYGAGLQLRMADWQSCLVSCCLRYDCNQAVYDQHACLLVYCKGKTKGFCRDRPSRLTSRDLHGIIIKHDKSGQSLWQQLGNLQFRNGPSKVTSDMRFTYAQQCAQYVEQENVTGVATSWATKRFSPFNYMYQDNGHAPPLGIRSSVPLGGLGTGSFELRADGTFTEWTLENQSPGGSAKLGRGALDLAFLAVRVQTKKGTKASLVRTHPPQGYPGVSGIGYSGGFPVSRLDIEDGGFHGVHMELFAYSAFKARSALDSALPAVIFSLRIRNPTAENVDVSLLLNLPLGVQPDTSREGDDFKVIRDVTSDVACARFCRSNANCMAWSRVDNTCSLKGSMPLHAYKRGVTSGVKHNWTKTYGRMTCTRPGDYPNSGNTTVMGVSNDNDHHGNAEDHDNESYETKTLNFNYRSFVNSYYNLLHGQNRQKRQKQHQQPTKISFSSSTTDDINQIWKHFTKYGHLNKMKFHKSGFHGSAVGKMSLGPGENGVISLVMSWFYPNRDHAGDMVGQYYRNIFNSSEDVAFHTKQNLFQILQELQSWRENITPSNKSTTDVMKSSIPDWLQDMLVNSLSSWRIGFWVADGRWRQWETFDCNDVDSVHNDFQRELPFLLFFPGLLENVVRAWAKSQTESGIIVEALQGQYGCWLKTNKLDSFGGRINMADVNPAFIAQVYHLYKWAGKVKLLQDLWPAVKKAAIWMIRGTTGGSALPLRMTNTYDILQLQNYDHSMYNGVMHLLGLRVAEEMAKIKEDVYIRLIIREAIEKASSQIDDLFWDQDKGFYHAWWDHEKGSPPWLMADSLYGQVWAYTLGLGELLPAAKMRSHLEKEAIFNDTPFGLRVMTTNGKETSQHINKRDLGEYTTRFYTERDLSSQWRPLNYQNRYEQRQDMDRDWERPKYIPSYQTLNSPLSNSYSTGYYDFPKMEKTSYYKSHYPSLYREPMANEVPWRTSNYKGYYGYGFYGDNAVYRNEYSMGDFNAKRGSIVKDNTSVSSDEDSRESKNVEKDGKAENQFSHLKNKDCSSIRNDMKYKSIWMGSSPDWTTLQIHLGLNTSLALKQAYKALDHYRSKLNDLWNIHGLTAGSGHGLDGQPWCTSHYTFHMVLWHIPLALSGQDYSIIRRSLYFEPKLAVPYSLPYFVPYASGNIEAVNQKGSVVYKLTVTHGYLVLKHLSISGVKWPGNALKLEKEESISWSE